MAKRVYFVSALRSTGKPPIAPSALIVAMTSMACTMSPQYEPMVMPIRARSAASREGCACSVRLFSDTYNSDKDSKYRPGQFRATRALPGALDLQLQHSDAIPVSDRSVTLWHTLVTGNSHVKWRSL
jgi:hypothetical protein